MGHNVSTSGVDVANFVLRGSLLRLSEGCFPPLSQLEFLELFDNQQLAAAASVMQVFLFTGDCVCASDYCVLMLRAKKTLRTVLVSETHERFGELPSFYSSEITKLS